jgi:hypothetical protein
MVTTKVLLENISFSAGDEIAVAGAILAEPRGQLTGYEGDASQVVIAGYAFVPEEFVAPRPIAATGLVPFESNVGGQ